MRLRQKNLSSVFSPGGKNCLYHKFKDDRKLEKVVIWWLKTCGMNLYQRGIERSVIRYEKCLIFSVDYVQMYWKNDVQLNFNRSDFFLWCCGPTRVMAFSHVRFLDHTQRRTTAGGIPPNEWSARRRNLWQHTTLTKDRHPCPDGIQTHNPSRRVGAGLRLRRRGHWERPTVLVGVENTNRQ